MRRIEAIRLLPERTLDFSLAAIANDFSVYQLKIFTNTLANIFR